jgi:hypothetical protein
MSIQPIKSKNQAFGKHYSFGKHLFIDKLHSFGFSIPGSKLDAKHGPVA